MKKWTNNIIVHRKYLILITFSSKIESLHSVFQDLPVMHDRAKLSNIYQSVYRAGRVPHLLG